MRSIQENKVAQYVRRTATDSYNFLATNFYNYLIIADNFQFLEYFFLMIVEIVESQRKI